MKKLAKKIIKAIGDFAIEYPYTTCTAMAWAVSLVICLIILKW